MKKNAYYEKKKKENYKELRKFTKEALYGIREEEEAKLCFFESMFANSKVISIIAFVAGAVCGMMEGNIALALIFECLPYVTLFTACLCIISYAISALCAYFMTKKRMNLKRIEREIERRGG